MLIKVRKGEIENIANESNKDICVTTYRLVSFQFDTVKGISSHFTVNLYVSYKKQIRGSKCNHISERNRVYLFGNRRNLRRLHQIQNYVFSYGSGYNWLKCLNSKHYRQFYFGNIFYFVNQLEPGPKIFPSCSGGVLWLFNHYVSSCVRKYSND